MLAAAVVIFPVLLAFLSGIPALVYQVVWTREVALLAGSQVEAISVVLVAFFSGLALGSARFGRTADRFAAPLRLYGRLECGAGALALLSPLLLSGLRESGLPVPVTLAAAGLGMLLITFLMGGTLPSLLRSVARDESHGARVGGWIVGANTAGALVGVLAAVIAIPELGLRASVSYAGLSAIAVGGVAFLASRPVTAPTPVPPSSGRARNSILVLAALAGFATLSFEVLAARGAALRLGSTLAAWAAVLGLTLLGLALGNLAFSRRAARTANPLGDLALVEIGAATWVAAYATWGLPSVATPAAGVSVATLIGVGFWLLPTTFLMGAAFPLFVRAVLRDGGAIGAGFGRTAAWNTAGGVVGAVAASFVMLPAWGLTGAVYACAASSTALGIALAAASRVPSRLRVVAAAALGLTVASWWAIGAPAGVAHTERHVLFVGHGTQASVAVVHVAGRRDLIVDGDTEASTWGDARLTGELLASLPLTLHPDPKSFLELGLGSGITLGEAARFPLERIHCVEISREVLAAARYFEPDNRWVASGDDPRVNIAIEDARVYLARHRGEYDVVVANTVHPWSVGATGLYSREYFERIASALRAGGLAAQWLPIEQIGADHLAAILRTFFAVFPEGGLWWGAESVLAIGANAPLRTQRPDLSDRVQLDLRIADASALRAALPEGEVLSDDRPQLEARGARRRAVLGAGDEFALLSRLALKSGAPTSLTLWIKSRAARRAGDDGRADALENAAEAAGFGLAAAGRLKRRVALTSVELAAGRLPAAREQFSALILEFPAAPEPRLGLAIGAIRAGDAAAARESLEWLVARHPESAPGWNLLAAALHSLGEPQRAERAVARALTADPFYPDALANAGLFALSAGKRREAELLLDRLRSISPLGPGPQESRLEAALHGR